MLQLYIRKEHRILDGPILTSTFGYENEVNTRPNSKLQHPLPFPANPRAFDCPPCPWGREFESCPDGVGNFERKCQVLPMEYLSLRRCLRPKFYSFVNVKKVKVADFGFYKIIGWAFQPQFLPRGGGGGGSGNLNKLTFKTSNARGVTAEGMLKFRIDRPITDYLPI